MIESTVLLEPYGFIYITTNILNGKRYIGQKKWDNASRWKSYLGSGYYLMKDIDKYGKENFNRDIVDYAFDLEELNKKERIWISEYDAVNSTDYYNAIDGGDVSISITKCNPVINIDTNYIFKSMKEASLWSGYTYEKVKSTLNYIHNIEEPRTVLIFKNLKELELGHKLCAICAKNFKDKNSRVKYCTECKSSKFFNSKINNQLFVPSISNSLCFSKNDKWVVDYLKTTEINTSMNYKESAYIVTSKNKEPKVSLRNKNKDKKTKVKSSNTTFEEYKDEIIKLYSIEKMNFSEIERMMSISKLNSGKIKQLLLQWKVTLRPNCYLSYNSPHLKKHYFIVSNGSNELVFQYYFELKYWAEKITSTYITRNRLNYFLNNNQTINNFYIKDINEKTFNLNKDKYKKVDEL